MKFGSDYLEQNNANATIQVTAPINNIAAERLFKAVNTTGSYNFPIGDFQHARNGVRKVGEISITNNNIGAATTYGVAFDSYTTAAVSFTSGTDLFSSFINSGQWSIVPSAFSTTGTVDITFKTSNYTNGRVSTGDYVLLRRAETSTSTTVPWVVVSGASISENAGVITVSATGLAPFSTNTMFCIGLKATTTTWTGAANNGNWSATGNWSNGVPNSNIKAIFNSTATNFPTTNIPTSNGAATLEIQSGATIALPTSFTTPIPILNNGTIEVKGTGNFVGFGHQVNAGYHVHHLVVGSALGRGHVDARVQARNVQRHASTLRGNAVGSVERLTEHGRQVEVEAEQQATVGRQHLTHTTRPSRVVVERGTQGFGQAANYLAVFGRLQLRAQRLTNQLA
ncbi:MAG: hypothetical protein EOO61_18335, partial [Hymenobacter sp.]